MMKPPFWCVALFAVAAHGAGYAQTREASSVVRMDPALDAIISSTATLEWLVQDGFGSTEGPVWVKEGRYLLFTDRARTHRGRIHKLTPEGNISIFLEPTDSANGAALDQQGRLVLCTERGLVRVERDGTRIVLADSYQGKPLLGPNDLVVKSDGSVYFTDELAVYRWKDGVLHLVTRSVDPAGRVVDGVPGQRVVNGIGLSPDEKFLYLVVIPTGAPRKIVRYELRPDGTVTGERGADGTITDERVFVALPMQNPPPTRQSGQPDGVKVDRSGNVYFGGPGGLWIVSPTGKHLGTILIPGGHSNLAFGDSDGKGLYITTGPGIARIRLNAPAI